MRRHDPTVPEGARRCTLCGKVKPVAAFPWRVKARGVRHGRCKVCCRASQALYRESESGKAAREAYERSPGRLASYREKSRRNYESGLFGRYRSTVAYRLQRWRSDAGRRAKTNKTARGRASAARIVEAITAELDRMKERLAS